MNLSLWDILTIPKQKDRLWEALGETENLSVELVANESHTKSSGPFLGDQSWTPVVLTNEGLEATTSMREGKLKPNPFFLTLIVGDKLYHNSMIYSDASTTIMPKEIAEVLN